MVLLVSGTDSMVWSTQVDISLRYKCHQCCRTYLWCSCETQRWSEWTNSVGKLLLRRLTTFVL